MKLNFDSDKISRYSRLFVVAALFITIFNYLSYVAIITVDIPWGDHWIFLKYGLVPYESGELSLMEYLWFYFKPLSHGHVLTLLQILINKTIFGLNYIVESFLGTLFLILSVIFCFWLVKRYGVTLSTQHSIRNGFIALATLFVFIRCSKCPRLDIGSV